MNNQTSKTRVENLRNLESVYKIFGAEIFEEFLNSKGYSVAPNNLLEIVKEIESSENLFFNIPLERDGCEV